MSDFRSGMKAAVPTALGYVAIGLAFGVVAAASGLSALEVALMCALVYGGSAQFAKIGRASCRERVSSPV